ncbi:hypothetical protein GN956_G9556 [Arapaima gigas]
MSQETEDRPPVVPSRKEGRGAQTPHGHLSPRNQRTADALLTFFSISTLNHGTEGLNTTEPGADQSASQALLRWWLSFAPVGVQVST